MMQTDYRIEAMADSSLDLDTTQLFRVRDKSKHARWFVNGRQVNSGHRLEYTFHQPGRYELLVEYDGRRVKREILVMLDMKETARTKDILFLIVAKQHRKLYVLPVPSRSATLDLLDRRDKVLEQFRAREPAAFDFQLRQNEHWSHVTLSQPSLDYSAIREGVYALYRKKLFYLAKAANKTRLRQLKKALAHDDQIVDTSDANPKAIHDAIMANAHEFDTASQQLMPAAGMSPVPSRSGGAFEQWVEANISHMFGHFSDHMAALGVNPFAERLGILFTYNTQNFTFSTRFSDKGLGITRQFTTMLGFVGVHAEDEAAFGSATSLPATGNQGLIPVNDILGDGSRSLLTRNSQTGKGGLVHFGGTSNEGALFDSGQNEGQGPRLFGPVDKDTSEPTDQRMVPTVFNGPDDYEVDTDSHGTRRVSWIDPLSGERLYFLDETDNGDGSSEPDEPQGEGGNQPDDNGGDDDTGDGNGGQPDDDGDDDQPEDEDEDQGENEDNDDGGEAEEDEEDEDGDIEPGGGGEVSTTPPDSGVDGGRRGGALPPLRLQGGGCRGGGYTCPTDDYGGDGQGMFELLGGAICPMGGEQLGALTQPGPLDENAVGLAPTAQELQEALLRALTQPGPTAHLDAAGLTSAANLDGEQVSVRLITDASNGSVDAQDAASRRSTFTYRVTNRALANGRGMSNSESILGVANGANVNGLFGFAGVVE